jgi:hypothetical protein
VSAVTVRAAARDVRDVAETALAWADGHRADFTLGEDALAAYAEVNRTWKPLGELAQVCATVTALTAPADPLHTRARDLLAHAWEQTGRGALFRALQRQEPFATYPLEVYAAFAAAGLRHRGYERAAATVARTRGWRLTEQDPTRRLGVRAAERHSGITRTGTPGALRDGTWLGGLPEPWTFERSAGYALTHVVFHLTDWGRAVPAGVPARLAEYLTQWLPPWLDTCLDAGLWDLSCELLAVAAAVPGSLDPPARQEGWQRLAAARYSSGARPEVAAASADDFTHCYHSTLMTAFAAVLTHVRLTDVHLGGQGALG